MNEDKKWLEDAQELWWNELTIEEQELVQADAIMEERRRVEWEEGNEYPCSNYDEIPF